jgi:flagellar biosynthetic protein FliP
MTIPMVGWMRHRAHGWRPTWEMAGSMIAPTVVAIALLWSGVLSDGHTALMIQHVAMLPAMLAVMLLRRDEYTGHAASTC